MCCDLANVMSNAELLQGFRGVQDEMMLEECQKVFDVLEDCWRCFDVLNIKSGRQFGRLLEQYLTIIEEIKFQSIGVSEDF